MSTTQTQGASNAPSIAARLDRLPLTSFHRKTIAVLALLFFFDFGDQFALAFAGPAILKTWHLEFSALVVLTSLTFLGMALGAPLGGLLADRFGRKSALLYATLWVSVFSLLNALAPNIAALGALRFLIGIGLTAVTAIVSPYVAEFFPAPTRGTIQGRIMIWAFIGTVAIGILSTVLLRFNPLTWRLLFAYGALGIVAIAFLRRLPESPRWLASHGKNGQATHILATLEEIAIHEHGALPALCVVQDPPQAVVTWKILLERGYRGRVLHSAALLSVVTLGVLGFVSFVPTLLSQHGYSLVSALWFSAIIAAAAPLGAGWSTWTADRFERKQIIGIVCILIAVLIWLYGLSTQVLFIVGFGFLSTLLFQGLSPLLFSYVAELFPTEVRALAWGTAYGISRLTNVLGPLLIGVLFKNFGYLSVFGYLTACWVVAAVIMLVGGLSTTKKTLEQLNLSHKDTIEERVRAAELKHV